MRIGAAIAEIRETFLVILALTYYLPLCSDSLGHSVTAYFP